MADGHFRNLGGPSALPVPAARKRRSSILKVGLPLPSLGNETIAPARRRISFASHFELRNYDVQECGLYEDLPQYHQVKNVDHTSPVPVQEREEGQWLVAVTEVSMHNPSLNFTAADATGLHDFAHITMDGMELEGEVSRISNVIKFARNMNAANRTIIGAVDMEISQVAEDDDADTYGDRSTSSLDGGQHNKSMFHGGEETSNMSLSDTSSHPIHVNNLGTGDGDDFNVLMDLPVAERLFEQPAHEPSIMDMSLSPLDATKRDSNEMAQDSSSEQGTLNCSHEMDISRESALAPIEQPVPLAVADPVSSLSDNDMSMPREEVAALIDGIPAAVEAAASAEPEQSHDDLRPSHVSVPPEIEAEFAAMMQASTIPDSIVVTEEGEGEDMEMSQEDLPEWNVIPRVAASHDPEVTQMDVIANDMDISEDVVNETSGMGGSSLNSNECDPNESTLRSPTHTGVKRPAPIRTVSPGAKKTTPDLHRVGPSTANSYITQTTLDSNPGIANSRLSVIVQQKAQPSPEADHSLMLHQEGEGGTFKSFFDMSTKLAEDGLEEPEDMELVQQSFAVAPDPGQSRKSFTAEPEPFNVLKNFIAEAEQSFADMSISPADASRRGSTLLASPHDSGEGETEDIVPVMPENGAVDMSLSQEDLSGLDEVPAALQCSIFPEEAVRASVGWFCPGDECEAEMSPSAADLTRSRRYSAIPDVQAMSMDEGVAGTPLVCAPINGPETNDMSMFIQDDARISSPALNPLPLQSTCSPSATGGAPPLKDLIQPNSECMPESFRSTDADRRSCDKVQALNFDEASLPIKDEILGDPDQAVVSDVVVAQVDAVALQAEKSDDPLEQSKHDPVADSLPISQVSGVFAAREVIGTHGAPDESRLDNVGALTFYTFNQSTFPTDDESSDGSANASRLKMPTLKDNLGLDSFESDGADVTMSEAHRRLRDGRDIPSSGGGDATFVSPLARTGRAVEALNATVFSPYDETDDSIGEEIEAVADLIEPIKRHLEQLEASLDRESVPTTSANQAPGERSAAIISADVVEEEGSSEAWSDTPTQSGVYQLSRTIIKCNESRPANSTRPNILEATMTEDSSILSASDDNDPEDYDSEFMHFMKMELVDMMVHGIVEQQGVGKWTIEMPGRRTVMVLYIKVPLSVPEIAHAIPQIYCAAKMMVGKIRQEDLDRIIRTTPRTMNFIRDIVLALLALQTKEEMEMVKRPFLTLGPPPVWTMNSQARPSAQI